MENFLPAGVRTATQAPCEEDNAVDRFAPTRAEDDSQQRIEHVLALPDAERGRGSCQQCVESAEVVSRESLQRRAFLHGGNPRRSDARDEDAVEIDADVLQEGESQLPRLE